MTATIAETQAALAADEKTAAGYALRPDGAKAMLGDKLPQLVKGAGYIGNGNAPLTDEGEIFKRAFDARNSLVQATKTGIERPDDVRKSLNPAFAAQFGAFMSQSPTNRWATELVEQVTSALSDLGKNITLTSPLNSGFVPFDLVAPSRLIYPVYSPLRNKIPRTQGQGTSRRSKNVVGISGSQTGGSGYGGFVDISIPELVQSGGQLSASNWPLNLPGAGNQNAIDIDVPYKFFGLTESISWLAQFAGQGFEDISALANLILLQEFMLNEEAMQIAGTPTALATPTAPTVTIRAVASGETALSPTTGTLSVKVTATNFFGETAASPAGTGTLAAGSAADISWAPVPGALSYNIYASAGATDYLMVSGIGGVKYSLDGALPSSGTAAPATDSGTSSANRPAGIWPTLSGQVSGGSNIYPAGWQAGYFNGGIGKQLQISVIEDALQALWNGAGVAASTLSPLGAFRADPTEIIGEGSDMRRLSDSILNSGGNNLGYRLFADQTQVGNLTIGAAVSEFVNPITRSMLRLLVHPWLPQGTAALMSYTPPVVTSNVSNIWEMVMVQDYLSISWPVIDASFRYSLFMYGAMVCNAPMYCGLLGGLQVSADTATILR